MSTDAPNTVRDAVMRKCHASAANKVCFDCSTKNPTWASPYYGVWLCMTCAATHRSIGVHLSFVRSTQLDTWSYEFLWNMVVGGNTRAHQFFQQHGCTTNDASAKYSSRAASLYREKISALTATEMRKHGENILGKEEETKKEEADFFDESQHSVSSTRSVGTLVAPSPVVSAASADNESSLIADVKPAAASATAAKKPTTLGTRKVGGGLGATKKTGGLGAAKKAVDFDAIEQEAKKAAEERERLGFAATAASAAAASSQAEVAAAAPSQRLAYQSAAKQTNMSEEKKKQLERLGMGLSQVTLGGTTSLKSHTASSDMTFVQQEGDEPERGVHDTYRNAGVGYGGGAFGGDSGNRFDSYGSSSIQSEFGSSRTDSFGRESSKGNNNDFFLNFESDLGKNSTKSTYGSSSTGYGSYGNTGSGSGYGSSAASARPVADSGPVDIQKFSNAKGISSDQVFGRDSGAGESTAAQSRFSGSRGISSDQYFGGGSGGNSSSGGNDRGSSDFDALRRGAQTLSSTLSNLAGSVLSDLQERYS